jgi:hypothetical protein
MRREVDMLHCHICSTFVVRFGVDGHLKLPQERSDNWFPSEKLVRNDALPTHLVQMV